MRQAPLQPGAWGRAQRAEWCRLVGGLKTGVGLERLDILRSFFGDGLLAGLEVFADANAVKASVHSPRNDPVAVLEPGDGER
jgi:hypothetical protein